MLNLVYFAWVREAIGLDGEQVERPVVATTIAELIAQLSARGGGYAEAFAHPEKLRAALDQQFVPIDTAIGDARELAIFPPVTGG